MNRLRYPLTLLLLSLLILQIPMAFSGDDDSDIPSVGSAQGDCDIDWKIIPVPFLSHDQGRKIVRLGKHEYSQTEVGGDQSCYCGPRIYKLEPGDCTADHKVIDHGKLTGGLGILGRITPSCFPAGLGFAAAILPFYGRKSTSERTVPGHTTARFLDKMKVPKDYSDVLRWNEGDKFSYLAHGGLKVLGAVHYFGVGLGIVATLKGEWGYSIERLPGFKVKVVVTKRKIKSISARAGAILLANASVGLEKGFEKDISYTLDLGDDQAREAFKYLIHGDLTKVHKLSQEAEEGKILLETTKKGDSTEGRVSLHMGLPILLSKDFIKSNVQQFSETINHEDLRTTEMIFTSVQKKKLFKRLRNPFKSENRRFRRFKHEGLTEVQNAASYTTRPSDDVGIGPTEKGHYAEIIWNYSNDNTTEKEAQGAVRSIMQSTGLGNELAVEFPAHKNLGYVGIQFKVTLSKPAMDELLEKTTEDSSVLITSGDEVVNDYFAKGDSRALCKKKSGDIDEKCVRKIKEKIVKILRVITYKLEQFNTTELNDRQRGLHMAAIAKLIRKDPFVLMTLLSVAPQMQAQYRVEGEHFLTLEKDFLFSPDEDTSSIESASSREGQHWGSQEEPVAPGADEDADADATDPVAKLFSQAAAGASDDAASVSSAESTRSAESIEEIYAGDTLVVPKSAPVVAKAFSGPSRRAAADTADEAYDQSFDYVSYLVQQTQKDVEAIAVSAAGGPSAKVKPFKKLLQKKASNKVRPSNE